MPKLIQRLFHPCNYEIDMPYPLHARLFRSVVTLALFTAALTGCADLQSPPPQQRGSWSVVEVVDGDTIDVRRGGREDTVRLLNIDTPERSKPGYDQATEALKRLVSGGTIHLKYRTPGEPSRGDYDRLLAYVYANGENVNVEMVRLGWSSYWTEYGESRFAEAFEAAERTARSEGRGPVGLPR